MKRSWLILPCLAGLFFSCNKQQSTTTQASTAAVTTTSSTTTDSLAYIVNGKSLNFINGKAISNTGITGQGIIDGNGSIWWQRYQNNSSTKRPRLVYISNSQNLNFSGITLKNSPSMHLFVTECSNVMISGISISSPSTSPNTDGIDPGNSDSVTIQHCTIDCGDDNIAIKAGYGGSLCQKIRITHCSFLNGHGLSIGSETNSGVSNVQVDSCLFTGTTNGIRIKSAIGLGGQITGLSYTNTTMTNVTNPLIITFTYSQNGNVPNQTDTPSVNGFTITNLTATGSKNAGSLIGLSNSLLQNIALTNVTIQAKTGMTLENAAGVNFQNVNIAVQSGAKITTRNVTGTGF
ncbi:MAG TPA: glycosyl hydrolase family 28 protein [Puia sp.]|nr:glycosyl hydrolase family 28 protein [Puia sp.]